LALALWEEMMRSVADRKLNVKWNSDALEVKGGESAESVVVKNRQTGKKEAIPADGIFIAIGEIPVSELASSIGITIDDAGYIVVDKDMRTNIPRVYAVGDVTGGIRQIVTAAGTGAIAALSAFQDISAMRAK